MRTYYVIFNGGVSVTLEADGYAMEEDKVVFYAEGLPLEGFFAADVIMIDQALEPEKPSPGKEAFRGAPMSGERDRQDAKSWDALDSF